MQVFDQRYVGLTVGTHLNERAHDAKELQLARFGVHGGCGTFWVGDGHEVEQQGQGIAKLLVE